VASKDLPGHLAWQFSPEPQPHVATGCASHSDRTTIRPAGLLLQSAPGATGGLAGLAPPDSLGTGIHTESPFYRIETPQLVIHRIGLRGLADTLSAARPREVTMADVRITCINKEPRQNPHEGITHLGGAGWRWARQQVVESISAGTNTFYTFVGGRRANIGVVNGPNGPYVRTYADGAGNDNLLALAECI